MDEVKVKRAKRINPDRVMLDPEVLDLIKRMQEQIDKEFSGVLRLTNKDLTNFVLKERKDLLSKDELNRIRLEFFDEVRAARWTYERIKKAKAEGTSLSLNDVLGFLQTPRVNKKRTSKKEKAASRDVKTSPDSQGRTASDSDSSRGVSEA